MALVRQRIYGQGQEGARQGLANHEDAGKKDPRHISDKIASKAFLHSAVHVSGHISSEVPGGTR
jgi:hypothetical protein